LRIIDFSYGPGLGPKSLGGYYDPRMKHLYISIEVNGKLVNYNRTFSSEIPYKYCIEDAKSQLGKLIMDSLL